LNVIIPIKLEVLIFPIASVLNYYQCYPLINEPDVTEEKNALNKEARLIVGCILCDTLVSITAIVVGVLKIIGIISIMPPGAAYALVTLSGVITLFWVFMAVKTKGNVFCEAANLLMAAVASNPEPYLLKSLSARIY
jgi:hypothetical protein